MVMNGYRRVWEDNFKGDKLDSSKWTREVGVMTKVFKASGEDATEVKDVIDFADTEQNAYVKDGELHIVGRHDGEHKYSGGTVRTVDNMAFLYGYLEVEAKFGPGMGAIPAIWMVGAGYGFDVQPEVDIVETFGSNVCAYANLHRWWRYTDENGENKGGHDCIHCFTPELRRSHCRPGDGLKDNYHKFALDWTPEHMEFYMDGVCYLSVDITKDYYKCFHQPMFVIMSTRLQGTNNPETEPEISEAHFRYVHLYQREGCKIFDPKTQLDEIKKCNVPIDKKTLICNP
jgi:beta-glucanase (GH16 family)